MDGQNIPHILQDLVPLGPLPCSQLENLEKKDKQGKGTYDHILTLVDYSPLHYMDQDASKFAIKT